MQRLKKINQYGPLYLRDKRLDTTRFEHSVGCAMLLQRFGAPIEAQVAGLLHDVSHSAFSHLIDYIFDKHATQDWHDRIFEKFVLKSDIPPILERHGLDTKELCDKARWRIASQALPELSADKIDYGLRDSVLYGIVSSEDAQYMLNNLTLEPGEWCFTTVIAARMFAMAFNQTCEKFWGDPFWTVFMQRFAEIMKAALDSGLLYEDDLHLTDDVIVFKLMKDPASAAAIEKLLQMDIAHSDNNWDLHVINKARLCNPRISSGGHLIRLSEVDDNFREKLDYLRYKIESGYFVRIL
jgi:HD superfamily phosphohydrolase